MNLLEVLIMFWHLSELFWVIYLVWWTRFQKVHKIITMVDFYEKQAPYIFNHAKPSSIWMGDQNYKRTNLVLGNMTYLGKCAHAFKRLVSRRDSGSIHAVHGTVTKCLSTNQKQRLLSTLCFDRYLVFLLYRDSKARPGKSA